MVSLVIYILSFLIIIGILTSVTNFFNNNIRDLNTTVSSSSEYNKFNLYFLNYTKNGYSVQPASNSITFAKTLQNGTIDTAKFTFVDSTLYYNKVKLCENVNEFNFQKEENDNEKEILKTSIKINGTVYTTDYVIE